MNMLPQQNMNFTLPFKSVALALLFGAILGPVGLLYSSLWGGVMLILIGAFVLRGKLYALVALVWLVSCVWNVAATNKFNRDVLRLMLQSGK